MGRMFYYTYKIEFDDGCYYYGSRKSQVEPHLDVDYNGSPKTMREHWDNVTFRKIVLETFETRQQSFDRESELIGDNFKTDPKCLNRSNKNKFYCEGHTPETREKMCRSQKGRVITEEHKQKLRDYRTGRKQSEETKRKIRENGNLGKKFGPRPEEWKRNISKGSKGKRLGNTNAKCYPTVWNGVTYPSRRAAARAAGLTVGKFMRRFPPTAPTPPC